jgi:tetratricopeptide (TPR) repeat protein
VGFPGDDGRLLPQEELFAGWRLFFELLAAQHPVVLLVEDAEHADAGLLDFLEHLADRVQELPVFVLVFARPELAVTRPGLGSGRNRSTLALDPLDAASMDALLDALVPGMPAAARAQVTGQAQGVPLFAVETIRSLIDRDVVRPIEGVYRLVGEVGDLQVPEGLQALLAARLDALDPPVRQLVADAAVLGTSFSPGALTAVSSQGEQAVRAGLAELLRREVLSVSADPLSPQRGSYRFTHQMLRQVAYRTMSRRDRKARHLTVAAYLRQAFSGDGEEVTDIVASHYLDALNAVPDDPDVDQIRGQAIATLTRAAERAQRTGAPALAAASYATAAQLTHDHPSSGSESGPAEGLLWEHAAEAALTHADWAGVVAHVGRAREYHTDHGDTRAAARAQVIAGHALRRWDHLTEAREQLTAALAVLREDPGTDTVRALTNLAAVEVSTGSPDADALTAEALALGQALGAGPSQLGDLLGSRAIYLSFDRPAEAVACWREAARLYEQAGDEAGVGNTLFNTAETLMQTDPAAAADAARAAIEHTRRAGARHDLAYAVIQLGQALVELGDWDAAEKAYSHAADAEGLAESEYLACYRGWLAALRGDTQTAQTSLAAVPDTMRASSNPQNRASVSVVEAFTAAARRQPHGALRHARATIACAIPPVSISEDTPRWAWSLAARTAHDLNDTATTRELLAILDPYEPERLAPMLRAERDLARARLTAAGGGPETAAAFAAAIAGQRQHSTPYHLAHGLLDHAAYLLGAGDDKAARAAIGEARDIAARLRCQPLLDRADTCQPTRTPAP